jgi:hypothetical protein
MLDLITLISGCEICHCAPTSEFYFRLVKLIEIFSASSTVTKSFEEPQQIRSLSKFSNFLECSKFFKFLEFYNYLESSFTPKKLSRKNGNIETFENLLFF